MLDGKAPDPVRNIVWQSNMIKAVIIAKVIITVSFLAIFQQPELLFFSLLLCFESWGYIGSSNLKANINLIFLSALLVSILTRVGNVFFFYSVFYDKRYNDRYFKEVYGDREDYKSYFFACGVLGSIDFWQIYTCIGFISRVSELSEKRLVRVKKHLGKMYFPCFTSQKNMLIR